MLGEISEVVSYCILLEGLLICLGESVCGSFVFSLTTQKEAPVNIMRITRWITILILVLGVASTACATEARDFRFPRELGVTPGGYPLPLTGKVLSKTPIVVKEKGDTIQQNASTVQH